MSQTRRPPTKRNTRRRKRLTPTIPIEKGFMTPHSLDVRLDKIIEGLTSKASTQSFQTDGVIPPEVLAQIRLYQAEQMIHEVKANTAREIARWRLASIARDLAPIAAGYARRGRPRLLATLAKLVEEPAPAVKVEAKAQSHSATQVILQKNKLVQ
jgi:hypothetical protein